MTTIKPAAVAAFTKFICARERHRVARESGRAVDKPDAIISQYRFCNVRRNDDRVTKWVQEWAFGAWRDDPHLWFALVAARLFNLPSTLTGTQNMLIPFKPEKLRAHVKGLQAAGKNVFNAAYIVSTAGARMDKVDYVIDRILTPAWRARNSITNGIIGTRQLEAVHRLLMTLNGLASFMAAQVVADLKYAHGLKKWADFHTFAASGPGSKRGLNRVLGNDKDAPMPEAEFRRQLSTLRLAVSARLASWEPITAQDIQNCLCEYDKYERARTGEGRPKQKYARPDLPWKEN
jgi:hypothetical protein